MAWPAAAEVVVIPVEGPITKAQFLFVRRALKEAARDKAEAVILDLDTPGGDIGAMMEIMRALLGTRVPTYAYVDDKALSAGALIAVATQHIYMAPGSFIGAAAPVGGGGEDLGETMKAKVVSAMGALARSAAEQHGHRPEVAEAFINKNRVLKLGGTTFSEKDELLSLSAQEAVRVVDGKPVLAEGVVDSLAALAKKAGLGSGLKRIEPTGFETLAMWVTMLAPIFLAAGAIGAWMEFKTPGFGVPGCLAAVCFLIYFAGHYVAGLSGMEAPAIFLIGVALILADVVLFPGTFLLGLAGVGLVFGSLLWAMVDWYPGMRWTFTPELLVWPAINFTLAMALAVVAAVVLARYLPSTSLYQRLVLGAAISPGASLPLSGLTSPWQVARDDRGLAISALRPSGRAGFGERVVDVVTEGDFIASGTPVRVVRVEGASVVVAAVET